MKTKKILATLLIASSAFLGTGYAWWTDGLEVKGVVSTGEFRVAGVLEEESNYTKNNEDQEEQQDIKSFSYDMGDLFPGKTYEFGAEFKNEGSIPAVIDSIIIETQTSIDEETKENITINGSVGIVSGGEFEGQEQINTTIAELSDTLEMLKGWRLEPEQSLVFNEWKVSLPRAQYDESKQENEYEGKNVSFDLVISFKQHNQQ